MTVYFLQEDGDDGYIKIGYSDSDVLTRLYDIQVGNARIIRVIGILPDATVKDEKRIHARFIASRIRGEWFKPTADLLAFVENKTVLPEWASGLATFEDYDHITGAMLEASFTEKNWLTILTYDIYKYTKLGGKVQFEQTNTGLKVRLVKVDMDSEGVNSNFRRHFINGGKQT